MGKSDRKLFAVWLDVETDDELRRYCKKGHIGSFIREAVKEKLMRETVKEKLRINAEKNKSERRG